MMIPITRKEKYINEIVGGGNTAPETPQTREELFFADILGEVNAPSPITRAEKYLAKIANKYSGELPEPVTRVERFLARAAGMDISIPTPVTREEMFWADYALIVEKEISGIPPLTFNAVAGTLKNYRIYGNTVNGESVGDRTGNLFDCDNTEDTEINGVVWNCKNQIITANGATGNLSSSTFGHKRITGLHGSFILANVSDTINACICVVSIQETPSSIRIYYISTTNSYATFSLTGEEYEVIAYAQVNKNEKVNNAQFFISLTEGSTPPDTYEPYGYRVPVTINSNTTNIYLPEQLTKTNDNTDYIDYATQKRYNADGTSQSVELPTLQTVEGTNTLSVGTTVQPSKVMVKIGEASAYKVRYYVDDTMEMVETVSDGKNAQGFTPTKASTVQYNYTFMGWSTTKGSTTAETGVLNDITADKSLYAVFSQSLRTFTVYFYNGSTLLQTAENVQYGGTATYTGETPTKDGFTFSGWQPSNVNITADTSCYAQFVEGVIL